MSNGGAAVEKLNPLAPPDAAGFRPKRAEFATYWKRGRSARESGAHLGQCWFARKDDGRLAGYITLLADRIAFEHPLLSAESVKYRTFPAVKIGLLAVDERAPRDSARRWCNGPFATWRARCARVSACAS